MNTDKTNFGYIEEKKTVPKKFNYELIKISVILKHFYWLF